jgi:SnoaL-like domain
MRASRFVELNYPNAHRRDMKSNRIDESLEPPIQTFIDATNRGDSTAFLTAFEDDAVLIDWGRTFTGKTEIAKWNSDENIGTQNHLRVTGVHRTPKQIRVTVAVTGKGYNGDGTFVFDLDAHGITRMVIS